MPGQPESSDRLIGGRYRLTAEVGQGSMGRVWRARDELLDRDVALKEILFPREIGEAEKDELKQRQLREARSAARLSHPAVAAVFDVVQELGRPWIVMEFVRGRSLDRVLKEEGPLPPQAVARIGQDVLAALAAAHAVGVVHRDVKPSNVLLTPGGRAVLTDFGVAAIDGDPSLTQGGIVMGTPAYSAPERIDGEPGTAAADLWSLGLTLYAAAEGQGPYDKYGSVASVIAAVATRDPALPGNAGPNTPVIMALLSRDPAARPTAKAAIRMLAEAATALPAAAPPAGYSSDPQPPDRKRHRGRHRGRLVMIAAAGLGIGLGVSLWAVLQPARQAPAEQTLQPAPGVTVAPIGAVYATKSGYRKTARAQTQPTAPTARPRASLAPVTRPSVPSVRPSSSASPAPADPPSTSAPVPGCGTLTADHDLTAGQSLASCDGDYTLDMQGDGNLVLYNSSGAGVWDTGTDDVAAVEASMQGDGNFVLYNSSGSGVWDTGTNPNEGAYLDVGNDGYVRIYSASGKVLWESAATG